MANDEQNKQFQPGQEPMLEPAIETVKKRAVKKPKPIVEGINSEADDKTEALFTQGPYQAPPSLQSTTVVEPVKVELTEAEKILMGSNSVKKASKPETKEVAKPQITVTKEDLRLMPKKAAMNAARGESHIFRNILLFVVALLLILGGYEFYSWFNSRPSGIEQAYAPQVTTTPTATPTEVATTPTPTTVQPTPVVKQLKITATPTNYLNVRSEPSTTGSLVTKVNPGDILPYTETKNGWYKITLLDGKTGWVIGDYIVLQQ
jgi:hypothetical protein